MTSLSYQIMAGVKRLLYELHKMTRFPIQRTLSNRQGTVSSFPSQKQISKSWLINVQSLFLFVYSVAEI